MNKRILHIVPNMNMGGLETFIMNVYRNIDRNKIQFDFLEHYKEESFYDKEITNLGGKIYHFTFRNDNNIFKYIYNLNNFFKEHKEYEVIHCHMESIGALIFVIAKIHGINIRIGHAHTNSTSNNLKGIIKRITSSFFKYTTTVNLACSKEAGKYLYFNKKFTVIPNGINFDKFKFNKEKRTQLRNKYNLNNKFVIGHVGRMDKAKNQLFLIDVFYEYQKSNSKSILVLIGDGELKNEIVLKVKDLNIEDKVLMLGVRSDINDIYSMFDLFLFPSLYEGLGIVLIEAQINGLTSLVSKNIPRSTKISDSIKYLPLDKDKWVNEIKKIVKRRNKIVYNTKKDDYDIKNVVKTLTKIYVGK